MYYNKLLILLYLFQVKKNLNLKQESEIKKHNFSIISKRLD